MRAVIDRKLERFGVSGPGRDWILRALHPAGDHKSPGLPDQSACSVLRPDYRLQATIQPPTGAVAWDLYIWTPPGDVNAVYWATGPAPCDFTVAAPPDPTCQVGVLRLQPSQDLDQVVVFNATDGSGRSVDAVPSVPIVNACAFRHQFKSVTCHLIAAAVADQGQVYAAQLSPIITPTGLTIPSAYQSSIQEAPGPPILYYSYYGNSYMTVLPTVEADLCAMAPQFYMDAAREGCYLPLRLAGPTQPFARGSSCGGNAFSSTLTFSPGEQTGNRRVGSMLTPVSMGSNGVGGVVIPWVFSAVTTFGFGGPAQLPGLMMDTGYDNTNVGVIIFRGLQGSGGGGFSASVQLKCVAGLEIIPNPAAPDRIFAEVAAPYEPRALEAYYSLCLELRDGYPASFNSLSSILDAIGSVASKIWGVFEPALTKAAPILVDAGLSHLMGGSRRVVRELPRAPPSTPRTARLVTYRAPSAARSTSMVSRGSLRKAVLKGTKAGRGRKRK